MAAGRRLRQDLQAILEPASKDRSRRTFERVTMDAQRPFQEFYAEARVLLGDDPLVEQIAQSAIGHREPEKWTPDREPPELSHLTIALHRARQGARTSAVSHSDSE